MCKVVFCKLGVSDVMSKCKGNVVNCGGKKIEGMLILDFLVCDLI